eukprot:5414991-Pyramimonas_sp.AAC.1
MFNAHGRCFCGRRSQGRIIVCEFYRQSCPTCTRCPTTQLFGAHSANIWGHNSYEATTWDIILLLCQLA